MSMGESETLRRLSLPVSTKALERVAGVNHEHDFEFIVGDERYGCPSFVAEFLSPRVSLLRSQDITIQEFSVNTEDPNHYFEHLISLRSTSSIA
jgi:hypothetical protein